MRGRPIASIRFAAAAQARTQPWQAAPQRLCTGSARRTTNPNEERRTANAERHRL